MPWARQDIGFTLLFEALIMVLAAAMPVAPVARFVGEHDTRLWRVIHHYVERARRRADFSAVTRVAEACPRSGHWPDTWDNAAITFDQFDAVKIVNDAVDRVRRAEQKTDMLLSGTRYTWVRNPASCGGFSKASQHHYGCLNARNRGTCGNLLTIRRDVFEVSVLSGPKTDLMDAELVKEFAAEYHRARRTD